MKKWLTILAIMLYTGAYGGVMELSESQVQNLLPQQEDFAEALALPYDESTLELDSSKNLRFMDLCKKSVGEKFFCNKDYGTGIRKYRINAPSIAEAHKLFTGSTESLPEKSIYDYGEDEGSKEDEVGTYYVWDKQGRLWIIGRGYDSMSVTIYAQVKDHIEVIEESRMFW